MKKIYQSVLSAVLLASLTIGTWQEADAQCLPRSASYWGEMLPNNGCGTFAVSGAFGPGEYFRTPLLLGASYTFSTCGNVIDTQLTGFQGIVTATSIWYNDNNGPDCAGYQASYTYVSAFTDYVRINVNQYNCRPGGTQSIQVKVRQNNNLSITSSGADLCQGATRSLTATPAPVATGQTGSGDLGTFTGIGVAGTTFTGPVPGGNSGSYTLTYAFGYCNTTQSITVYRNPSASQAGNDQTVCAATATLNANTPTYGTGTWTIVSGPGTITNPASPTSSVTGLQSGTPTVCRWTISNGPCVVTSDDVTITRDPAPTTANAGPNQGVCAATATLAGNTPTVGSGQWTLVGGSGTITTPTSPTSGVTGLGLGNNTFRWTVTNGVCSASTDDVVITRDSPPTTASAGPNQSICGSTTTLAGNAPAIGTGSWSVVGGTATVTTPGDPNSGVTGIAVGQATLVWTISNGSCAPSTDSVIITRIPAPALPTVSGNTIICPGAQTTLTASAGANSPTFLWWDAAVGGNTLAATAVYVTPALNTTTTFWVEVTDGNTSCTSDRQQVTVTVNALPLVDLGPDSLVCSGTIVCLDAGPGFTGYLWSTGANTQTICLQNPAQVWVQVTDSNGCQNRDTFELTTKPSPVVSLGADTSYCAGGTVGIGVPAMPGCSYLWNTGDTNATVVANAPGDYWLMCTDTNGCTGTDSINVAELNAPVASFSVDTSNCPNVVFTDNSVDANSWTWTFGEGSSSSTQSPSHDYSNAGNGTYTVTLVANGPCGADSTTQTVSINCLVGIDLPASMQINLYPNPNTGVFKVYFEGLESDVDLQVFSTAGQEIYRSSIQDQRGAYEHEVKLPEVAAGFYFVSMTIGDATISKRIMVQ